MHVPAIVEKPAGVWNCFRTIATASQLAQHPLRLDASAEQH